MPVRRADPPGVFIADHMRDVGGIDYPQNIHREYKKYLKAQGLKNLPCRATMSHYIWLANKMGLIVFDHADTTSYWDGQIDFPKATAATRRQSRPLAPSPRYFYKILDPDDPRWLRLETSHRAEIGIPAPPAFPRVSHTTPLYEEEVAEGTVPPPPEEKPAKKPRVKKEKPPKPTKVKKPTPAETAAQTIVPFEAGFKKISAQLDLLGLNPTLKAVEDIENEVADLGGKILDTLEGKRGSVREHVLGENSKLRRVLEDLPLIRSSLTSMLAEKLPSRRVSYKLSFDRAIQVVKQDLAMPPEEVK